MHEVREVGQRADHGNGEPIAGRLGDPHLLLHVLRQVRERVALPLPPFRSDVLIATGKGDWLERYKINLVGILQRKPDDGPHLVVVDAVDDGRHGHDADSRLVQVLDRAQFHVEQVADFTVAVGVVADPIKLQVGQAQTRLEGLPAELLALGELDAVGGCLHAVIAQRAGIADGVNQVRRHRRLTP